MTAGPSASIFWLVERITRSVANVVITRMGTPGYRALYDAIYLATYLGAIPVYEVMRIRSGGIVRGFLLPIPVACTNSIEDAAGGEGDRHSREARSPIPCRESYTYIDRPSLVNPRRANPKLYVYMIGVDIES